MKKNKINFVRIESQYPPYYNDNIYRGLWKLEKGFMGGPFLIKTYFIENKVVVNVGLIFAPQSRKRNFIKDTYKTLDNAIYGHKEAKTHMLQVIGKWMKSNLRVPLGKEA